VCRNRECERGRSFDEFHTGGIWARSQKIIMSNVGKRGQGGPVVQGGEAEKKKNQGCFWGCFLWFRGSQRKSTTQDIQGPAGQSGVRPNSVSETLQGKLPVREIENESKGQGQFGRAMSRKGDSSTVRGRSKEAPGGPRELGL